MGALIVAGVVHAGIGYVVWQAKFQPHYVEAPAQAIEAHLVQPPPPPPPPPPPKQPPKQVVKQTPHPMPQTPPPPTLRPRPTVAAAPTPEVLPIAPAPPAPKPPPAPAVLEAPEAPPPKPPERPHIVTNPDWLKTPNGDELARYYPEQAQRQGVSGQATINCAVSDAGGLVDCHVAAETPKEQGFGNAALKMAGDFKMRPETRDGVPVGGARISIPIRFRLPDQG